MYIYTCMHVLCPLYCLEGLYLSCTWWNNIHVYYEYLYIKQYFMQVGVHYINHTNNYSIHKLVSGRMYVNTLGKWRVLYRKYGLFLLPKFVHSILQRKVLTILKGWYVHVYVYTRVYTMYIIHCIYMYITHVYILIHEIMVCLVEWISGY